MARDNPYVGLAPYTEADAEWFFGREDEQRIIIANLRASRLTLVYGASGVGKSSLLLAGVVPQLRGLVAAHRDSVASEARGRDGPLVAERAPFAVAVLRDWRDPPLPALADTIRSSVVEASGADVERWRPGQSLAEAVGGWIAHVRTLLVILDQFEEYFLYNPDEDGPGTFAEEFPDVVNHPDLRVNFLLSLREDAWAKLDRFKDRVPELFGNYLRVDYLRRVHAREAILRPVDEYNRRLGPGQDPVSIRDDLVDAVLDDVRAGHLALAQGPTPDAAPRQSDDGGDRVETPYLQLVMARLWRHAMAESARELSLATLTSLGGAEQIVSGHLEEALDQLSPGDQEIAADVFGFLVTPSKTKIAQSASDLAYWVKRPEADLRRVLEELSGGDQRILRAVPPPLGERIDRYEIFHDVLADAVLEWRTLREQAREKEAFAERLQAQDRARRKARRDRRLRRLAAALGLAVVALTVALVPLILAQRDRARENRQARSVGLAAGSQAQLAVDPELSVLLAMEALDEKETPAAASALAAGLDASRVRATLGSGRSRPCGRACASRPAEGAPAGATVPADTGALSALDEPGGKRVSFDPDTGTAALVADGGARLWQPETGRRRELAGVAGASSAAFVRGGRELLVVREDGQVVLAPIAAGARPRVLAHGAIGAGISSDGRFLATVGLDGTKVVVRRVADGRRLKSMSSIAALGVAFSPEDPGLLLVEMDDRSTLWRWREHRTRDLRRSGAAPDEGAIPAGFSPDGRWVATAGAGGGVTVWDADTATERYTAAPGEGAAVRAVFDRHGTRLLTVGRRAAALRVAATGEVLAVLAGSGGVITSAAFSPDGARVAMGGDDGTIHVFESATGARLMELRGHPAGVADLEFTPDGRFLLSGDAGSARLWDVTEGQVLRDAGQDITAVAFSPDGRQVAVAERAGRGLMWTPGRHGREQLARERGSFDSAAVSPDGRLVAFSGSSDTSPSRAVLVIDRRTGATRRLRGEDASVVRFSPDGRFLLAAGRGRPRLWSRSDWRSTTLGRIDYGTAPQNPDSRRTAVLAGLAASVDLVTSGAFSRDGKRILLTTSRGTARVVDARTGLTETVFYGHFPEHGDVQRVSGGDFSPDGRWVVTAGDREALVWSARTSALRMRLDGHTGMVNSAAYSRDGRWIATAGEDRTVRVWDARTGRAVAVRRDHAGEVTQVAFSPRGDEILSADDTGVVRRYPCLPCRPLPELRALARERVTRELTREERAAYLGQIGA